MARRELASPFEDPLNYLPRQQVQAFTRRRIVYHPQQPSDRLYMVISGRVKITNASGDGGEVVANIVCPEGFFGEAALLGGAHRSQAAIALDDVNVMSWSAAEIEKQIEREPRLGLALSQYFVRQCIELQERMQRITVYKTPERVMLALVQLAGALGSPLADGSARIGALTHQTIAEYVGTSREIVTGQLNRLRRLGLLRYSRKHMDVYSSAIREILCEQGIQLPRFQPALTQAAK